MPSIQSPLAQGELERARRGESLVEAQVEAGESLVWATPSIERSLMPPDAGTDGPVLFAYDGSEHAQAAIQQAARLLRAGREAIVLSVWQPLESLPFWGGSIAVPAGVAQEAGKQAEQVAADGAEKARQAGFDAEPAVVRGSPVWERIVEAAKERGAGIIVIGSHGRSGAAYLAMGSVATAVAHHAEVPVLICRLQS
jgi:nucleotide-binding universal stress UspA family protein